MQRFTCITLFPQLLQSFRDTGIVRRAQDAGLIDIQWINPRDYADDSRGTVDDAPYGGGPGMVMMARPLRRAIAAARALHPGPSHVVYLSPQGTQLTEARLPGLACHGHLVLLCGRYEGIDERVIDADVDAEWSLGDFVLTGGEIPAMAIIDALTRRLEGALGDERSAAEDSFVNGLLDHPHFTRPEMIDGMAVPPVLLSGNHAAIARWRRQQALGRTWRRRPDLLQQVDLSPVDVALLDAYRADHENDSHEPDSQAKIDGSN